MSTGDKYLDLSFTFSTKDKSIRGYCDFIFSPHLNTCCASQLDITFILLTKLQMNVRQFCVYLLKPCTTSNIGTT
jgi:hypothetical protein